MPDEDGIVWMVIKNIKVFQVIFLIKFNFERIQKQSIILMIFLSNNTIALEIKDGNTSL
jgi:hypothetical protein